MRVLSIDPSISELGYACISKKGTVQDYGRIKTNTKLADLDRYKHIHKELLVIYRSFLPDVVVIESQYIDFGKGAGVLKTSQVVGVIIGMLVSEKEDIQVEYVHPKTVKKFLGLAAKTKRAEAKQASLDFVNMNKKYKITTTNNNISDAIVIGFTFLEKSNADKKL